MRNIENVAEAYPLPPIEDCLDSLGEEKISRTVDCDAGYCQGPVAPEERDKNILHLHLGTNLYVCMLFYLRKTPAKFQRALDIILSEVRWQTCQAYLDDVIVFSKHAGTRIGNIDEVLRL